MQITHYTIHTNKRNGSIKIALASDFHNMKPDIPLKILRAEKPDIITVPGDLMTGDNDYPRRWERFLLEAVKIAPVFYSLGNHEDILNDEQISTINNTGAILIDNRYAMYDDIAIGGLSSGNEEYYHGHFKPTPKPELGWLGDFEKNECFKLLLCHHPEYYRDYLKESKIDLIFSGHAHGGQIRLFGQGLFSPGQGFFPKLTSGVYDDRLIVSRGMKNNAYIPRLFNPTELVFVTLQ